MFKSMEEFDHHSIDEYGNVLNEKTGNILKPYVGNKLIDEFLSITEAVEYAEKHYNVKRTMLHKHLVYGNVRIERCND